MKRTWIVYLKEVRDNLRDRRTLLSVLLFGPLFGPILFAVFMGTAITMGADEIEKRLTLPVKGESHAPELIAWLRENRLDIQTFEGDPRQAVRDREVDYVLVIDSGYAEAMREGRSAPLQLVADRSRQRLAGQLARVRSTVNGWDRTLTELRLLARGIDSQVIHPLQLEEVDVSTPEARGLMIAAMLPYFILLTVLMGGFYLAIDTTAGERERGSLEPLLSTAARRGEILLGKLLATATFSLLALMIVIAAFSLALRFVPMETVDMSLSLDAATAVKLFLTVAPFAFLGASVMCLVASFTKSYKEAQTWLSVVMVVPLAPMIVHFVRPFEATTLNLAIPVLGQHVAMLELLGAEAIPTLGLILNTALTLLLSAVVAWVAWLFYRRESVLG
ncbi:ABC transporter permease [Natronospira bacteriovora]|uniref:ABC transporter permease n=1 Tax=Natronospira bacteriovora TaxID=3069753 RepID=A0ABU0W9V1_9GAMM|nr:ABC transporter permease [Natronospira sp. AB-CW4]MDQ2069750.1 ABC transporter permease [Natronospira sp. AB-CW4]